MAGSAGSPPPLVVCVCPNSKCRATEAILREELPEGWAGAICYGSRGEQGRWHKPVMKVEYVPREQSDALASAVDQYTRGGISTRDLELALKIYREATSE